MMLLETSKKLFRIHAYSPISYRMLERNNHLKKSYKYSNESGLTLIECLVAIALIASTIGVIAPITVLAVATRVQNQRSEQAGHIAQSEINRVRLVVERGGNYTLDDVATTTGTLAAVPAPDRIDTSNPPSTQKARPIDIDGDGDNDFAVQLFRTNDPDGIVNGQPVAFELGVRVYTARAVDTFTPSQLSTVPASLSMTSGEGEGRTRPLAVISTSVVKSDREDSLCDYYRYIDSTQTVPASC